MASKIIVGTVFERTSTRVRDQILGAAGALIVQADITSISYEVRNLSDSPIKRIYGPLALNKTSVIFNSGQTWSIDATGYNFLFWLPPEALPDQKKYRLEVQFAMADGLTFNGIAEMNALKLYFGDPETA